MVQNRETRNEPTLKWSINLQQRRQEYMIGKRQPLQQIMLKKLDNYIQKNQPRLLSHVMHTNKLKLHYRLWKQSRCPSVDEWIRKLWYIYTMEYYSAIKKNTFESVLMRWMKLEPIIPERKTPIQYTNTYIWNLERW